STVTSTSRHPTPAPAAGCRPCGPPWPRPVGTREVLTSPLAMAPRALSVTRSTWRPGVPWAPAMAARCWETFDLHLLAKSVLVTNPKRWRGPPPRPFGFVGCCPLTLRLFRKVIIMVYQRGLRFLGWWVVWGLAGMFGLGCSQGSRNAPVVADKARE